MKPNQAKIIKFGINYGIITGLIGIIYTSILIAVNMLHSQSILKSIGGFIVLIIPIIITISNFKKQNDNFLSVGQAIGVGVITAVVAALVTIIFTYLLTNFILPDFWDKSAEFNSVLLQQQNPNITQAQLNATIALQRKMAWITYPFILLFNLSIGFITSLITGITLKTTENL
tara:strand:- start:169615 stop:170133 length:519 start_codon:yes stop_codon:yes gene_type:complete